jgi:hypothetical protein
MIRDGWLAYRSDNNCTPMRPTPSICVVIFLLRTEEDMYKHLVALSYSSASSINILALLYYY